ncbi:uncharacterized protein LOC123536288 isoform X3 [Mercenaria mercenaria]|uniref:uncharacterized protein LOC123536288 isoform X3 n=2 Tax=Mercenaria mercenaria TaxID=6596 RepID=UPI00234E5D70|nr:uncharacterized protein LOC123536288 isoform X3 [Mercenaria mercenaria]
MSETDADKTEKDMEIYDGHNTDMLWKTYMKGREKLSSTVRFTVSLPVKAAGVLCVLGISFGIGTYVLYKIYDKFVRPPKSRKPSEGEYCSDGEEAEEDELCNENKGHEEMGNQQSSPVDIPVYFKAGYGVSFNKPIDCGKLRNRKPGAKGPQAAETIVKGNLRTKNGLVATENSNGEHEAQAINDRNIRNRVRDLGQLRIEIDESGFVDEEGLEADGDKLSNSLKGNFSPTSLCEKNFRIGVESESNIDTNGVVDVNGAGISPKVDYLDLNTDLGKSSVLLTPPSEDESSSSHPLLGIGQVSQQSTKSDVSDIHSELADLQQFETDEEREQLSPLPYDKPEHNSPEKAPHARTLKLKLEEIRSRSSSLSANSSSCTSPDSYSYGHKRTGSLPENSISGVSSPDLELLHSENGEESVVNTGTFVKLEDEIHVVEDEFESISKDIQELTKRYSTHEHIDTGSEIFKDIFQRYPSIRVRQSERGVHYAGSESDYEERRNSLSMDEETDKDLSWDLENMMDMVYSEGLESAQAAQSLAQKLNKVADERAGPSNTSVNTSQNSSSVNCSVDLGGSLYEDEFHLHLGTKALPVIKECGSSPESNNCACDNTDNIPLEHGTSLEIDGHSSSQPETKQTLSQNAPVSSQLGTNPVENGHNHLELGTNQQDNGYCSMDVHSIPCSTDVSSELELCLPVSLSVLCNISDKQDITDYADSEWKGDTPRAQLIREAYRAIPQHCQCCHLRRIRGDNYCGIRSTVYQTLVNCLPPLNVWASMGETLQHLKRAYSNRTSGIHQWNFANRISYNTENQFEIMQHCLSTLYAKMEEMTQHSSYTEREQYLVKMLNTDSDCDLELMEGVKLLMLLSALRLHNDMEQGNDVPVFAWLMFARDTSESVSSFVRNHLNHVGDSGGLEQVEMCLLGYSLGVRIRVFRLHHFREEDFISYYPEDGTDSWPVVSLIAEDDRHYNVPVL